MFCIKYNQDTSIPVIIDQTTGIDSTSILVSLEYMQSTTSISRIPEPSEWLEIDPINHPGFYMITIRAADVNAADFIRYRVDYPGGYVTDILRVDYGDSDDVYNVLTNGTVIDPTSSTATVPDNSGSPIVVFDLFDNTGVLSSTDIFERRRHITYAITRIDVSPPSITIGYSKTQQFTATADIGTINPAWTALHGNISSIGLYTAPPRPQTGTLTQDTVSATKDGVVGTASISLIDDRPFLTLTALNAPMSSLNDSLWSVHGFSDNDIWACGTGSQIKHFNGTSWIDITQNFKNSIGDQNSTLYAIWGYTNAKVWVFGASSTNTGLAAFTVDQGATWQTASAVSPGQAQILVSAWGPSDTHFFVQGASNVWHTTDGGITYTSLGSSGGTGNGHHVFGRNDSDVFFAGANSHWNGTTLSVPNLFVGFHSYGNKYLIDGSCIGSNEVIAAIGNPNTGWVLAHTADNFFSSTETPISISNFTFLSCKAVNANNIIVTGTVPNNVLIASSVNGSALTPMALPANYAPNPTLLGSGHNRIYSTWISPTNLMVAVGDQGMAFFKYLS